MKTNKLIKRVFALPCGEYPAPEQLDRPPLSWPLYSAIALWNASEEGGVA